MDKEITNPQIIEGYEYRISCRKSAELIVTPIDILVYDNHYYKICDLSYSKAGSKPGEEDHCKDFVRIEPEGIVYLKDTVWFSKQDAPRAINLIISNLEKEYEKDKDEYFGWLNKDLEDLNKIKKLTKENTNGN